LEVALDGELLKMFLNKQVRKIALQMSPKGSLISSSQEDGNRNCLQNIADGPPQSLIFLEKKGIYNLIPVQHVFI
jgi:hypothetical protein